MVVARAARTVMASSLNQNKFCTKCCCDGEIKPAPSPLGRWRKNDTIIRWLDGIFIEIFCVWGKRASTVAVGQLYLPIPKSLCTPWKTGINNLIIGLSLIHI